MSTLSPCPAAPRAASAPWTGGSSRSTSWMRSRRARAPTRAMSRASSAAHCRSSPNEPPLPASASAFAAHAAPLSGGGEVTDGRAVLRVADSRSSRRSNEGALGGVPSPGVFGRDVRAADPAVDAEQLDAVGLAAECCSPVAVSRSCSRAKGWLWPSGGGGGSAAPSSLSRSLAVPCPGGERAEEPGVAHEGRLLEPLRCNEGCGRCARAGSDRLEHPPFRPREAAAGRAAPPATGAAPERGTAAPRARSSPIRPVSSVPGPAGRPRRSWLLQARPVPLSGGRARASRAPSP